NRGTAGIATRVATRRVGRATGTLAIAAHRALWSGEPAYQGAIAGDGNGTARGDRARVTQGPIAARAGVGRIDPGFGTTRAGSFLKRTVRSDAAKKRGICLETFLPSSAPPSHARIFTLLFFLT